MRILDKNDVDIKKYYSKNQAVKLLEVSYNTLTRKIDQKKIVFVLLEGKTKMGDRYNFLGMELIKFSRGE